MHLKKFNKFLLYILGVVFVLSFSRLSHNIDSWTIDIFSHFTLQYASISLVLMSLFIWKKTAFPAIIAGCLFFFNISAIRGFGESIQATEYTGALLKVYSANIHISNNNLTKLNQDIQKKAPDILLLLEVTPEHFNQLQSLIKTYPYHKNVKSIDEFEIGFIFLSKFPILNTRVTKLSKKCNFVLEAMLDVNQRHLMFYGVHAKRPGLGNHNERKNQFLWLARHIKQQSLPVIVAGDFNATPYSPIFRELVNITGLKDSREGFGWQPSWPTFFPPLWIPIDHVLVTPDIQVRKRITGAYAGSDHYPVFTELSI